MPSDSHRRRLSPKAPKSKCKQCGREKANPGRVDGLGLNCGTYKDSSQSKAKEWEEKHSSK